MTSPLPVEGFGGLMLNQAPNRVGLTGASDMLNIDLAIDGNIRTRAGYDNFTASAGAARYTGLTPFYNTSGDRHLIASRSTTIEALDSDGTSLDTLVSPGNRVVSAARFGGTTDEVLYLGIAGSTVNMVKWDGTNLTNVAGAAELVAVQPSDNRLVKASIIGTSLSRVWFSDADAPETFDALNYVELTGNDGEQIMALVSWRDMLFAFKESKYFVFGGNSIGPSGDPEFNYRPVDTKAGLAAMTAWCTSPRGVFFLARDGIYLTAGGDPVRVSTDIDPIFRGGESEFYLGGILNHAAIDGCAMTYSDERLYFAFPSGASTTNDRLAVLDLRTNRWMLWNIPASSLSTFRVDDADELVFSYATGSNHIGRVSSAYTTDDGTAITWRYRSGLYGFTGREQRFTRTRLWGSGSVTWKTSRNWGSLSSGQSASLGTAPDVGSAFVPNLSRAGHWSSHEFSGSGAAVVCGFAHEFDAPHAPQTKTA